MAESADFPVARALARHWWVVLLRGVFAVLFGVLSFAMPRLTLVTLILIFGIYVLADGITSLIAGVRARAWPQILLGALGIVAGLLTFLYPGMTAMALLYLIIAWALARGIFEVVTAIYLRKLITNEWFLILSGLLSVAFGVILLLNPGAGALAMVWLIGAYALAFGFLLIVLAFRLRHLPERLEKLASQM